MITPARIVFEEDGKIFALRRYSEDLEDFSGDLLKKRVVDLKPSEKLSLFPYGPSAGGFTESIYFSILTSGEKIEAMNYDTSLKDRKISLSGKDILKALLITERINGIHSASYSSLFCDLMERSSGIEISQEIMDLRTLMMEMERISHHLFVAGRLSGGASQNIASMNIYLLREELLRITGQTFGHRYFFGINKPGGIGRDIDLSNIYEKLESIVTEYEEIYRTLMDSRIFIDRTDSTAIIRDEMAAGPVLRGFGKNMDGRLQHRYYNNLNVRISTGDSGDSLARYVVRSEEIFSSWEIVKKILDRNTRFNMVEEAKIDKIQGTGEKISGYMETPSGDLSMILSVRSGKINFFKYSSPSLWNLRVFADAMKGNNFADFYFGLESLGLCVSETGDIR